MTSLAELGQPTSYEDYQWQKLRKQMAAHDFSQRPAQMAQMMPGFGALEMFGSSNNSNCQCVGCQIYPRMISFQMIIIILLIVLLSRRSNF
jgi:hypothetical protein